MNNNVGVVPVWMKRIKREEIILLNSMANAVNDTALKIGMIDGAAWKRNTLVYENNMKEKIKKII